MVSKEKKCKQGADLEKDYRSMMNDCFFPATYRKSNYSREYFFEQFSLYDYSIPTKTVSSFSM